MAYEETYLPNRGQSVAAIARQAQQGTGPTLNPKGQRNYSTLPQAQAPSWMFKSFQNEVDEQYIPPTPFQRMSPYRGNAEYNYDDNNLMEAFGEFGQRGYEAGRIGLEKGFEGTGMSLDALGNQGLKAGNAIREGTNIWGTQASNAIGRSMDTAGRYMSSAGFGQVRPSQESTNEFGGLGNRRNMFSDTQQDWYRQNIRPSVPSPEQIGSAVGTAAGTVAGVSSSVGNDIYNTAGEVVNNMTNPANAPWLSAAIQGGGDVRGNLNSVGERVFNTGARKMGGRGPYNMGPGSGPAQPVPVSAPVTTQQTQPFDPVAEGQRLTDSIRPPITQRQPTVDNNEFVGPTRPASVLGQQYADEAYDRIARDRADATPIGAGRRDIADSTRRSRLAFEDNSDVNKYRGVGGLVGKIKDVSADAYNSASGTLGGMAESIKRDYQMSQGLPFDEPPIPTPTKPTAPGMSARGSRNITGKTRHTSTVDGNPYFGDTPSFGTRGTTTTPEQNMAILEKGDFFRNRAQQQPDNSDTIIGLDGVARQRTRVTNSSSSSSPLVMRDHQAASNNDRLKQSEISRLQSLHKSGRLDTSKYISALEYLDPNSTSNYASKSALEQQKFQQDMALKGMPSYMDIVNQERYGRSAQLDRDEYGRKLNKDVNDFRVSARSDATTRRGQDATSRAAAMDANEVQSIESIYPWLSAEDKLRVDAYIKQQDIPKSERNMPMYKMQQLGQ